MDHGGRWTWISRRINWRQRLGGDISGITAQFADAVRNDPTNLNAALRFVRFAQNAQELRWLAETFSSKRAYDYFELGGRLELAQNEKDEVEVIQTYMPKQMDEADAKVAVASVISAIGATSIKDMGKVMAELKTKYSGQMDMGKVGNIVKSLLN